MIFKEKKHTGLKRTLVVSISVILSAGGLQAQQKVVFPSPKMSVVDAVEVVKKQTGYGFAFDRTVFDTARTVDVKTGEQEIGAALSQLVAGQNVNLVIRNKVIAITRNPEQQVVKESPRTSDVYVKTNPGTLAEADVRRPEKQSAKEIPTEPATLPEAHTAPEIPQYSNYTPVARFGHIQSATPRFALKTNLLYTAATFTPNLAFEFGLGRRSTLELSGSYSWIGRTAPASEDHRQRVHMILRPEYRWWLCERYNGHFFGTHLIYSRYNVSGFNVPLLFDKEFRYDGHAFGAGVTYGYNWAFAKRWGAEFNIGLGYMYMDYDRYDCAKCDKDGEPGNKHYFGPTRMGVTLVFLLK